MNKFDTWGVEEWDAFNGYKNYNYGEIPTTSGCAKKYH